MIASEVRIWELWRHSLLGLTLAKTIHVELPDKGREFGVPEEGGENQGLEPGDGYHADVGACPVPANDGPAILSFQHLHELGDEAWHTSFWFPFWHRLVSKLWLSFSNYSYYFLLQRATSQRPTKLFPPSNFNSPNFFYTWPPGAVKLVGGFVKNSQNSQNSKNSKNSGKLYLLNGGKCQLFRCWLVKSMVLFLICVLIKGEDEEK